MRPGIKATSHALALALITAAWPSTALADCKFTTNSGIVGGTLAAMMKFAAGINGRHTDLENAEATIYFKGHRLRTDTPGHIQIIDLDKKEVTEIDTEKRQYTKLTLEQWRDQLKQTRQASVQRENNGTTQASGPEMHIVADMEPTSEKKVVVNWPAAEIKLTYAMVAGDAAEPSGYKIAGEIWYTSQIDGSELLQFYRAVSQQIESGLSPFTPPAPVPAQFTDAMDQLGRSLADLPGFPVQQTIRLEFTPPPAAKSAVEANSDTKESAPAAKDAADKSKSSDQPDDSQPQQPKSPSTLPGGGAEGTKRLLMFGAQHTKRKRKPSVVPVAPARPTTTTLLVIHSTVVDFSAAPLDNDVFNIPPGYQEAK